MKTIKEPNYFIFNPISNDNYPSLFNIPKMPEFIHNKPNLINNKFHFSPYFLNLINFPFFYNNNNNKDFIKFPEPNALGSQINLNLSLFNNNKYIFNPVNQANTSFVHNNNDMFNLNNFSNNNSLFNIFNPPYISRAFEKSSLIDNNDFQNPKSLSSFINKNNIIINDNFECDSNNTLNSTSKKFIFKSFTTFKRKRGRYSNKESNPKRVHTSTDFDNLYRKIQVHFLNFIVQFINEITQHLFPGEKKLHFLNIDYNIKKTVNHNAIMSLKEKNIGYILTLTPSKKYIRVSDKYNEIVYNQLKQNYTLKDIFDMNYLDFFNKYYISKTRTFWISGKEINFVKPKFFCDLLRANPLATKKMEEIARSHYNIKTGALFVINK